VLIVHPSLPVDNLQSLISIIDEIPPGQSGRCNYGSAGSGSPMHLGPELFKSSTSVEATHVPYRGETAALNDLVEARLTFMLSATSTATPFINSGRRVRQ
jgi:tripartite-type tricarboxylate transporter receptor subunit TctC